MESMPLVTLLEPKEPAGRGAGLLVLGVVEMGGLRVYNYPLFQPAWTLSPVNPNKTKDSSSPL